MTRHHVFDQSIAAGRVFVVTAVLLVAGAAAARATVDGDVRASIFPDADAVGVGAGVLTPVGDDGHWYFNPNMEVAFGDSRDRLAMNGDFHYDVASNRSTSVWFGGGPALIVTDPDIGDTRTDLGLNVLTGVGGTRGRVRPFGQLRGVFGEDGQVVLSGGIRF